MAYIRLAISVAFVFICASVGWDALETQASAAQDVGDPAAFDAEMRLAAAATDRDSKVEHFKKALTLRPNDPNNIAIEFRIAVGAHDMQDCAQPRLERRRGRAPLRRCLSPSRKGSDMKRRWWTNRESRAPCPQCDSVYMMILMPIWMASL